MKARNDVLLKDYTTLKIGGPARTFLEPENPEDLQEALKQSADEPVYILGKGSNVLFDDRGFNGTVIKIGEPLNEIKRLENNQILVQAGATNAEMADFAQKQGLSGYEFACGVPGTIGGAIIMNAGCYGGETRDVLKSVRYLDRQGNLHEKSVEDLDLSYRHSWFTDHFGLVVDAIYQLEPGDPARIQQTMDELQAKRYAKQPMDMPSCGSTFKRPEGYFAAALIDETGLRGYQHGHAMVSDKHTGFLVNDGQSSAQEFLELIEIVQQKVKEKTGVDLECEVKKIEYEE